MYWFRRLLRPLRPLVHAYRRWVRARLDRARQPTWTSNPSIRDDLRRSKLEDAYGTIERILVHNVLPFWDTGLLDRDNGGFRLNHDVDGTWMGPSEKYLVTQARTTWFFSWLSETEYGTDQHLEAARHGYRFLRDHMWDPKYGGFFWSVDNEGREATAPRKQLYAQGFGLYALTAFARAGDEEAAVSRAFRLFELLEDRAHDPEHGGYQEAFRRDWHPQDPDDTDYLGSSSQRKLVNTHLHLLEGLTAFVGLTRDSQVEARVAELILVLSSAVIRTGAGVCTDKYERDWTPLRGSEYDRVSYGHLLEHVLLLGHACDTVGLPEAPLRPLYRTFFDYALAYGFDRNAGGFYDSGPLGAHPDNRDKIWWVQAEALAASIYMYERTGDPDVLDCFFATLDWIEQRQVDWEHGDWHTRVPEWGAPYGPKAGEWKSPYHHGRALILCAQSLRRLIESPTQVDPATHNSSPILSA